MKMNRANCFSIHHPVHT